MKFCDRPDAIAFTHAFILTVKVLDKEQQTETIEMGANSTKPDSDKKTEDKLLLNQLTHGKETIEDQSEKDAEVAIVKLEIENGSDENVSWSLRTRSCHKKPDSPVIADLPARCCTPQESEKARKHSEDYVASNKVNNTNVSTSADVTVDTDTIADTASAETDTSTDVINTSHKEASGTVDEMASSSILNRSDSLLVENENSNSSDSSIDSANLPYQYLIERDIERELEISRLADTEQQKKDEDQITSPNSDNLPNCNSSVSKNAEDNIDLIKSPSSPRKSGKLRSRQNSKDSDTSPPPEVANLRSSNITDLVMKGLMFTIRQDKDTVTVVEQKTKVELDEVLENSEKVETKEGDPCLLNSSLLRLEKMVTRMQEPTSLPEQRRNGENPLVSYVDLVHNSSLDIEADVAEKKDQHQNTNSFESANCWSDFFGSENITDSSLEKMERALNETNIFINGEDPEDEIKLKIESNMEDEDIVPKAYSAYFTNTSASSKRLPLSETDIQDLLMSDFDFKDTNEVKSIEINDEVSDGSCSTKDSSKLPKIISNEVITDEELPEMLLKAIQGKSVNQKPQKNVNNLNENSESACINNNNKSIIESVEHEMEIGHTLEYDIKTIDNQLELDTNIETSNSDSKISSNKEENTKSDLPNCVETEVTHVADNNHDLFSSQVTKKKRSSKNVDVPDSNSNLLDNSRMTRSNSKLQTVFTGTSVLSESNDNLLISDRYIETRSHKTLERDISIQTNKFIENEKPGKQKRKKSVGDKVVAKIQKSENSSELMQKDVCINVQKLMKDLKYGVKVVIKRLDANDIVKK